MSMILQCLDLRHRYGDRYALGSEARGVDLEIERGELFALLGPSGCGKTTTLRIIGGFLRPTSGRVVIDGQDVTDRPPHQRPTNTVFQTYALFPHMSLGANVAFGLQMEGIGRAERGARVAEALRLVGLPGMEKRKVTELSGGQAQRAALARAIVKRPSVLLLDEPLGALDLRLRRQMQEELTRLKASTATTFVHVTHDQEEACAIADRIAIMEAGRVVQVDTPLALFRAPRTAYVAAFIDAGALVRGRVSRRGDVVEVATPDVRVAGTAPGWLVGDDVAAVIAPDRVSVGPAPDAPRDPEATDCARGRIERVTLDGRTLTLALVKNPVGFNEVLRMLTETTGGLTVPTLIAINDRYADGRDVSWLWDVDFELLADGDAPLFTTGIRGADMANRLKYAGVPAERILPLGRDLRTALDRFLDSIPEGGSGYVLPTYTAMLDLRAILTELGAVESFWKQ
jgi:ABC-type Fe3+/spermidine/putrescine transport system ATPase subunit